MIGEYLGRKKLQYSLRANKCYYVRSVFQLAIFSIHATKAPSLRPPPLLSSARDNFSRWIQLLSWRTDLIATVDTTKRCTRSNKWEMEKWRIVTLHLLPSSLSSRIVTWENSIDREISNFQRRANSDPICWKKLEKKGEIRLRKRKQNFLQVINIYLAGIFSVSKIFEIFSSSLSDRRFRISVGGGIRKYRQKWWYDENSSN